METRGARGDFKRQTNPASIILISRYGTVLLSYPKQVSTLDPTSESNIFFLVLDFIRDKYSNIVLYVEYY